MSDAATFYASDEGQDNPVELLQEMKRMADEMAAAKKAYDDAQAIANGLKKQYEVLSQITIPQYFKTNGISSLETSEGNIVRIQEKYTCSPNKNDDDRKIIYSWLREQGGEDLIKANIVIPVVKEQAQMIREVLDSKGIQYDDKEEVNTNSLKSWLLDQLGKKQSIARIEVDDIPKQVHFWQYNEAEIILV